MRAKSIGILLLFFYASLCRSQSIEEQLTVRKPNCRDVSVNAPAILSQLYDAARFDSIHVAVDLVKQYCGKENVAVLYTNLLLDIQEGRFSLSGLDSNNMMDQLLRFYPVALQYSMGSRARTGRFFYYYYEDDQNNLYLLFQRWAKDLIKQPGLTADEKFICNILAGNTLKPETALRTEKEKHPAIYQRYSDHLLEDRLNGKLITRFMLGVWVPVGHLSFAGSHPSFGVQLGAGEKKTEIVLTMQARFFGTPHDYTVFRNDSLYTLHNYLGTYLGGDYTRYFYQRPFFEAGLTGGIAYDIFNIGGSNTSKDSPLNPADIGSLNLNGGVRLNYFFSSRSYVGLQLKYNYLDYKNKGGRSLAGDAVTMDLIFGH